MDLKNLWVAEYSASQHCFHVATLDSVLVANTNMVIEKNNNDYLMFWVGETYQEANAACDAMAELHRGKVTPSQTPALGSTSNGRQKAHPVGVGIEQAGSSKAAAGSTEESEGV